MAQKGSLILLDDNTQFNGWIESLDSPEVDRFESSDHGIALIRRRAA
jgi:hypothetical protein